MSCALKSGSPSSPPPKNHAGYGVLCHSSTVVDENVQQKNYDQEMITALLDLASPEEPRCPNSGLLYLTRDEFAEHSRRDTLGLALAERHIVVLPSPEGAPPRSLTDELLRIRPDGLGALVVAHGTKFKSWLIWNEG